MDSLENFIREIAALITLLGAVFLLWQMVSMEERREEYVLWDQAMKSAVIMDAAVGIE